ncbi:hypothetical protein STEG23_017208, partial [Scotinomys teguina]
MFVSVRQVRKKQERKQSLWQSILFYSNRAKYAKTCSAPMRPMCSLWLVPSVPATVGTFIYPELGIDCLSLPTWEDKLPTVSSTLRGVFGRTCQVERKNRLLPNGPLTPTQALQLRRCLWLCPPLPIFLLGIHGLDDRLDGPLAARVTLVVPEQEREQLTVIITDKKRDDSRDG